MMEQRKKKIGWCIFDDKAVNWVEMLVNFAKFADSNMDKEKNATWNTPRLKFNY